MTVFWGIAAGGTFWEWSALIGASHCAGVMIAGASTLAVAVALAATGHPAAGLVALAIGAIVAAAIAPAPLRVWLAAGIPYSGSVAIMPIILRSDPDYGLVAIMFLFAIVWIADIVAYFSGRAIVLKVDTDAHPELSARYKIRGIPNFAVFRDGRMVLVGAAPAILPEAEEPERLHAARG